MNYFLFFLEFVFNPKGTWDKKTRTTSDDTGGKSGKSVSEKSMSTGGKCVRENSTVGNMM